MKAKVGTDYEAVIGLEVHAQLLTQTKLFCGCEAAFGAPPNSLTCPVCLAHPGALPVLNDKAVDYAIRLILAVGGEVQEQSVFARKNYFYPDLPKGYQISQYDQPIGIGGNIHIDFDNYSRDIRLLRIHLEEDAGKLIHPDDDDKNSLVDFNRCGVPLLEIVTEPDIRTAQEAHAFLTKLKRIMKYLKICSGDMEKGALRCDANISLRKPGSDELGVRTELKNLNSFRFVEQALGYEIGRQISLLERGETVIQETLLWDEKHQQSTVMRGKEESEDYRYFPEPDLLPLHIRLARIEKIRNELPEMPDARSDRIISQYGITPYDAAVLTEWSELADYFEAAVKVSEDGKLTANWLMVEVLRVISEQKVEIGEFLISPNMLGQLLCRLKSNIISGKMAKEIFEEMAATGKDADTVIETRGLKQITDPEQLTAIIDNVLSQNREQAQQYRDGKTGMFNFLVGQVMKATGGQANPELVNKILREKLNG